MREGVKYREKGEGEKQQWSRIKRACRLKPKAPNKPKALIQPFVKKRRNGREGGRKGWREGEKEREEREENK